MRFHDGLRSKVARYLIGAVVAGGAIAGAVGFLPAVSLPGPFATAGAAASEPQPAPGGAAAAPSLDLTERQTKTLKIEPVAARVFPVEAEAVGSIDFNEDMATQVFTNYQGRIVSLFARVGDDVRKDQPLFTIDSPDLVQAESTLISAAGVLRLTSRALDRAKDLYGVKGLAQKDYDQAVSDQQAAEGSYKAAVDALRMFGKSLADAEKIAATRKVDSILVVASPIAGRVTARSAAPGLFVQPGNAPAPFTVADISTMWMLGNVAEADSAAVTAGQAVKVSVMAHPGHVYEGRITTVGATVDPVLHTLLVRSEVQDPAHELRPGMFAHFVITTGRPVTATAVPVNAVVREGDGTMTVWVTADRHSFVQRVVRIGLQHDGYDQSLDGLKPGDLVVTDGAVFLDNMLAPAPTD
nr:efflux RND transporter periplasmic adaptor subunit [uncultured Rhodopila sp.]